MSGSMGGSRLAAWTNPIPVPATAAKLVFDIPPTLLRKGYGYSFRLGLGGGCATVEQTAWPKQGKVNPGPNRCLPGARGAGKRLWHTQGQDDRQPGCVYHWRPESIRFAPDMPTGWLLTHGDQAAWGVVTHVHYPPPSDHEHCGNQQRWAGVGLEEVPWRTLANGNVEYVCRFTQYADYGQAPDQGWFWGEPWHTPTGPQPHQTAQPHDAYLRLDTIDYSAELRQHLPIYRFDTDETFFPMSPGGLAEFFDPAGDSHIEATLLTDDLGAFATAHPSWTWESEGIGKLSLEYLGANYGVNSEEPGRRDGDRAGTGDYLDARGDADDGFYDDDARVQQSLPAYRDRVHARAVHGCDGRLWLQYWLFYYDNPKTYLSGGRHEGDWELVQVRLNDAGNVDRATFGQHAGRESRAAENLAFEGSRLPVYVAHESHASYVAPIWGPEDRADGGGLQLYNPIVEEIGEGEPSWRGWPGRWGGSGTDPDPLDPTESESPHGPGHGGNADRWADPSSWDGNAQGCD